MQRYILPRPLRRFLDCEWSIKKGVFVKSSWASESHEASASSHGPGHIKNANAQPPTVRLTSPLTPEDSQSEPGEDIKDPSVYSFGHRLSGDYSGSLRMTFRG